VVSAVVLVNTDLGQGYKVLTSIKTLKEVKEAHALLGVYDLLVKIQSNSIDGLRHILKTGLREVAGVSNVLTLMMMESPS
jgi:DNA-binding Lrp family transcriptional regulator